MNRIILSLVLALAFVTTSCQSQEPPPTTSTNQVPSQPLTFFTNEVVDENILPLQTKELLTALRRDTSTVSVTVRRLALPNAAKNV